MYTQVTEKMREDIINTKLFKSKLNIGSGVDYLEGWVNLDLYKKSDICHDLEVIPLPFKDNKFDLVYAAHILEHINNLSELYNDLWRITKPDGWLIVVSPYYTSPDAWGDPDHVRAFSEESFIDDFLPGWHFRTFGFLDVKKIAPHDHKCKWIFAKIQRGMKQ